MNGKFNILVIDDSDIDRLIIKTHCLQVFENSAISEAVHGENALHILENCGDDFPDLILVDINMPILGGFDFLRKYEEIFWDQHPDTIIYIISSSNAEEDIQTSKELGSVKGFLTKPMKREKAEGLRDEVLKPSK